MAPSISPPPQLDPVEQRVLGALLEKQTTVPASYPLSLNALRTACNQTNSREPLSDYDDRELEETARRLRDRDLVRLVWTGSRQRTVKYHQRLAEALELSEPERAVLTVLLLRGPQAPGQLKTRTERLHPFADRSAVESVLAGLARRQHPLVQRLERRPGEQDPRWVHLLGPVAQPATTAPAPAADLEGVLSAGATARDDRVRAAYDAVAVPYAEALADELSVLPLESWLLGRIAAEAGPHPVVEVGCGPGHVTAHLAALGVDAHGIDVSPAMIEQARLLFPDGSYQVGDLRRLMRPAAADGWGAVLAWYSLNHFAPSELPGAVAALVRPLRPGGLLVLAAHTGGRINHVSEWFGREVDLDGVLFEPDTIRAAVAGTGLDAVEWYHRGALPGRGEFTDRFYLLARR